MDVQQGKTTTTIFAWKVKTTTIIAYTTKIRQLQLLIVQQDKTTTNIVVKQEKTTTIIACTTRYDNYNYCLYDRKRQLQIFLYDKKRQL